VQEDGSESEEGGQHGNAREENLAPGRAAVDGCLKSLGIDVTYASSGRQKDTRCFLDAMHAVLGAMCGNDVLRECKGGPFTKAVKRLTLDNVDSLEHLRDDLGIGEGESEFDWQPLENVLALRPSFFRLLKSTQNTDRFGRRPIGPKTVDPLELSWRQWLMQAQTVLGTLGKQELLRLWIYVDLCTRWRARLDQLAEEPVIEAANCKAASCKEEAGMAQPKAKLMKADFPTLGGGRSGGDRALPRAEA